MTDPSIAVDVHIEDHQVLVAVEGDRLEIAIGLDPSIERDTLTAVLDDTSKELDHVLDVGPEAVARCDLAADGGRDVDVKN